MSAELEQASADLGIDSLDADSLIAAEESLDTEETRLTERDRLIAALRDAGGLLRQRTSHRDKSAASLESARSALESAQNDWKQWLTERSLLDAFSPENIEELRRLVDLGRTHHRNVTDMKRRIAAIRTDIEEFLDIVTPLRLAHGFELLPDDYPRAAAVADDLIELHQQVSDQSRAKADAQNDLRAARNVLKERERNLKKIQQEIDDLLNAAGAQDADDFHRRAEIHAERQRLKASIDSALDQLQRISGPGPRSTPCKRSLLDRTPDTIADDIRRVEQELAEVNERIEAMVSERTTTQNSLNSLRSEEDSSRLRAERHRLREGMRSHAREWAVRTIAQNLLRVAQGKFEKERQPDVIRHSEKFFRDITEGRYTTVFSPLDESEIYVTDSAGAQKQPAHLSRGAREQLFLSLRFGLIREHGQRAEKPPRHRGRGTGQLRPRARAQGRSRLHRAFAVQSGSGLHLPSADSGPVCGCCIGARGATTGDHRDRRGCVVGSFSISEEQIDLEKAVMKGRRDMRLEGKTAIITGAAGGMGAEEARLFAREGASVVVADVTDEDGEAVVRQIVDTGGEAIYLHADVTSVESWDALVHDNGREVRND